MEETYECVICGKVFAGYGNNAEPVCAGRCCNACNTSVVLPARIKNATSTGKMISTQSE